MGDAMINQTTFVTLFFYIVILVVGLDFLISGLLIQSDHTRWLERPKLLGQLLLRINQSFFNKMRGQNRFFEFIYSLRWLKFFMILAGVLIMVGALIPIIDILF